MTSLAALRRRSRREWLAAALVLAGLAGFVLLVYVVVVLGGGVLIGHTTSPDVTLSVLATAVVALAFGPVQARLEALASRAVHGGQPSPYDVLARFSQNVSSHPTEELPTRMARVLADGTGAAWTQVWLVVGDRTTLAATWPPDATREPAAGEPAPTDDAVPGRRSRQVRQGGELLGVLVVQEREHVPLTSVEERLFAGLASQAGLVLRGARLRAELESRLVELTARAGELSASRQRMVDAQDAERRRLERDIHDGAQQHLVALAVNLRLAETLAHAFAGARRRSPRRPGAGSRRRHRDPAAPVPGHLPAAARGPGARARAAGGGRQQPGACHGHDVDVARYSSHRGGCGVLLLPGGGAERCQALGREQPSAWSCAANPDRWTASIEDDGVGVRRRPRCPPAAASRTCATGSSRSTAR